MKKILAILLAGMMTATAFAGCGGGASSSSQGGSSSQGSGESSAASSDGGATDEMTVDANTVDPSLFGDENNITLKVWAPDKAVSLVKEQVEAFKKAYPDKTFTKIEVVAQGENNAAANLMNDPSTAADVFGFASDQASNLYPGGFVANVRADYANAIKAEHLEGAVDVSTNSEGKLVAFPETGDNGYIVYYNKSLVSADEVKTLEGLMAACEKQKKQFILSIGNGFYGCIIPLTGGGTYSLDEEGNQVLNYDKKKVVKSAKAFADVLANNSYFSSADTDKVLASNLKNKKALAGVSGTWKRAAIENALGDDFACAKLPTIKIDGTDTDIVSMYGYKLIGVNNNSKYPRTSQALAYYLSGEKCQKERAESDDLGWGPSITKLVESDIVTGDPCLSAMYAQREHSVPQIGLAGSFWDPTGAFGAYVVEKKNDLSEEGIGKAYDNMYTSITAN